MTKDLLEAVFNDEQGCLDAVEEDYLQTSEHDKHNTELKDNCKKIKLSLIQYHHHLTFSHTPRAKERETQVKDGID